MATLNPFDLLGDDAEDPSQLAASLPKKVEKTAPVLPAKGAKFPPSSQAVRESKNAPSGGRGGRDDGRGAARGKGGGQNRDFRNNDGPANANGYSRGYNRSSEEGDGARRGGSVGGYRAGGGGRGGGRRGEFSNGESGDFERPRRTFERHSGTGRSNDLKREGGGRGNWGTTEDDIPPTTEEPTTEVEKSPVVEKQGGEDETTDANKEPTAAELEKEAEEKQMTLEEYEKIQEEKKKAMQGAKVEERKVDTKVFESMQQLSNKKKTNEEIFIKLGAEKRKDAAEKEEKTKKVLSINEFLKPAEGESYNPRGGYRGGRPQRDGGERGERGGRPQRDGGERGGRPQRDGGGRGERGGRGQRDGDGRVNGGENKKFVGAPAPAIGDTAQFPTLGK